MFSRVSSALGLCQHCFFGARVSRGFDRLADPFLSVISFCCSASATFWEEFFGKVPRGYLPGGTTSSAVGMVTACVSSEGAVICCEWFFVCPRNCLGLRVPRTTFFELLRVPARPGPSMISSEVRTAVLAPAVLASCPFAFLEAAWASPPDEEGRTS